MTKPSSAHGAALDATVQVGPPAPVDLEQEAAAAADTVSRLEAKLAKFERHVADIRAALADAREVHAAAVAALEEVA